jgi:hypothetical protein
MIRHGEIYEQIASLGKPYLGPAAEKFIARQCFVYLNLAPKHLAKTHVAELARVDSVQFAPPGRRKATELAAKIAKL